MVANLFEVGKDHLGKLAEDHGSMFVLSRRNGKNGNIRQH